MFINSERIPLSCWSYDLIHITYFAWLATNPNLNVFQHFGCELYTVWLFSKFCFWILFEFCSIYEKTDWLFIYIGVIIYPDLFNFDRTINAASFSIKGKSFVVMIYYCFFVGRLYSKWQFGFSALDFDMYNWITRLGKCRLFFTKCKSWDCRLFGWTWEEKIH